ncbi:hypothetical protein LXL04_012062 [Taraxacum kok-saghyz]
MQRVDVGLFGFLEEDLDAGKRTQSKGGSEEEAVRKIENRSETANKAVLAVYYYLYIISCVCNVVEDGEIVVKRVSSEENPADPLTKGLAFDKHSLHAKAIGMRNDVKFE